MAIATSERELSLARKLNFELKRDLDDRCVLLQDLKEREVSRDREL
jgi:hypothetical protein